jgi:hypothetical protein
MPAALLTPNLGRIPMNLRSILGLHFLMLTLPLALSTGCGVDAPLEEAASEESAPATGGRECSTTNQCKALYAGATDCRNYEGGTCYCGSTRCSTGIDPGDEEEVGGEPVGGQPSPSWLKFSGSATFASGTLTFVSSGRFQSESGDKGYIWKVPSQVTRIVINAGVQVTGAFTLAHSATIEGRDRRTSVIYGTRESSWADRRGLSSIDFAAVGVDGSPTVHVENLTIRDSFGFMIRGGGGSKIHVDRVDFIDTREGGGNHSDGFVGGDGSTVSNSYFSQGDDAIKVYWGKTTYTNVTIDMRQNTVPIQLGWGNYGSGAQGIFRGLTITGDNGRNPSGRPIIDGAGGSYQKTIVIEGADFENEEASLVRLSQSGQSLNLTIRDARIHVGQFSSGLRGRLTSSICDSTERKDAYDCR